MTNATHKEIVISPPSQEEMAKHLASVREVFEAFADKQLGKVAVLIRSKVDDASQEISSE